MYPVRAVVDADTEKVSGTKETVNERGKIYISSTISRPQTMQQQSNHKKHQC